ncbi:MAG: HigA family addiction module antitoxin [Thermodesulfovibrionales bacterium]|jgi:addiction module HigA family antidote
MHKLKRDPTHPGDILKHDFMEPLEISQTQLAHDLGTSFRTVNEIVNHKRGITPEMAIRLSRYFSTSEELWMNLQGQYDLAVAKSKKAGILDKIRPYQELHRQAV